MKRTMIRLLAAGAIALLAACGGGGDKPVSEETDCAKLGDRLVKIYDEHSDDTGDKADAGVAELIEVSNRMDELGCPSPSS